jgi:23S rRNA pseudouridine955/2504/2580 synthase
MVFRMAKKNEFDIDVLYESQDLVALTKPAGLAMHGGTGVANENSLVEAVRDAFDVEPGFKGPSFLGRLDRLTSGIVLAALSREGLQMVNKPYLENHIAKDYLCIVHGKTDKAGEITVPLGSRKERHKGEDRIEDCHTEYERLAIGTAVSLLRVRLHTGRQHQIRRHMKEIGHPVVADPRYGHRRKDERLPRQARKQGLMLHSWKLSHALEIALPPLLLAKVPDRFTKVLHVCGIENASID